jgi:signal transduction histidine kinase
MLNAQCSMRSASLPLIIEHSSFIIDNMSHELRTPLNAIIGFSELLAEGNFGELNTRQARYVNNILTSGHHLLQ